MKSIIHTVYRNGAAGLSNLIMSVELGVLVASLSNRVLVLKGNKTPVANVVQYGGLVRNTYPSRVTDLIDLGVPWMNWTEDFDARYAAQDLCDVPPWKAVFYFPSHLDLDSEDFRSFAKDRERFVTIDDKLEHVPALAMSGGKSAFTLGYYSSFFYLGRSAQQQAYDTLKRMKPKEEISEFANKIADDLGSFNAVHIRRGDFKQTLGVTTLERKPAEVLEALDAHFDRTELLVILTDEANDPFFEDIKLAYRHHLFLDHYILEKFHTDFSSLPAHDSISLAFISQLVASRSQDFIGTMTSTFTAMIQRMRGNLGKEEPFKYLWSELPPEGAKLHPGRHEIGHDIRLVNGVMADERDGPYSWNRVNQRLNISWMREWPESFLNEADMLERAGKRDVKCHSSSAAPVASSTPLNTEALSCSISFLDSNVAATSDDAGISKSLANLFALMAAPSKSKPIGEVRIETAEHPAALLVDGKIIDKGATGAKLLRRGYREVARFFINKHTDMIWLHASAAALDGRAIVLPGSWGRGKSSLVLELCRNGWSFLSDDIVPLDPQTGRAVPFPGTPQVRSSSGKVLSRGQLGSLSKRAIPIDPDNVAQGPTPLSMIVFPKFVSNADASLTPVSPAQAVGDLLENCLSFPNNDDASIQALCDTVQDLPTFSLRFGDIAEASKLVVKRYTSLKQGDTAPAG